MYRPYNKAICNNHDNSSKVAKKLQTYPPPFWSSRIKKKKKQKHKIKLHLKDNKIHIQQLIMQSWYNIAKWKHLFEIWNIDSRSHKFIWHSLRWVNSRKSWTGKITMRLKGNPISFKDRTSDNLKNQCSYCGYIAI
jgi:hypothetical protein